MAYDDAMVLASQPSNCLIQIIVVNVPLFSCFLLQYIQNLGVQADKWVWQDVYGTDPDLLSIVSSLIE